MTISSNNIINVNNPVINSGNEQPGEGVTVKLGESVRDVKLDTQVTTPAGPGVTNTPVQTKPLTERTITGAAKAEPKAYQFNFEQLTAICNGKYNVGEVALDKDGKLTKINNHVHFTSKNTVVTTPEQNAKLRQQVYKCIEDKYINTDKEGVLSSVRELLLGEGRECLSLSRDELARLLKGIENGDLANNYDTAKSELEDIRKFKTGEKTVLDNAQSLIKGLKTAPTNEVVAKVSVNARQDLVWSLTYDTPKAYNTLGMGSAGKLLKLLYKATLSGGQSNAGVKPIKYSLTAKGFDGKLQIYKGDVFDAFNSARIALKGEGVPPGDYKAKLAERMLKEVEVLCRKRLKRRNPMYANPGRLLLNNAQQGAKRSYVRQSFNLCDYGGKPTQLGSQFCFFNSVINAVLASNDPKAQKRLGKMFRKDGFEVRDGNGEVKTYNYKTADLPKTGNYSLYEESLNKHFKLYNSQVYHKEDYNYGAGTADDAAKVLGMEVTFLESQFNYSGAPTSENKTTFVNDLKTALANGKFVTYCEKHHYVAVKGIELQNDGSVKISIIDDAVTSDSSEYDKTYTDKDFLALFQDGLPFNVLEWQPEEGDEGPVISDTIETILATPSYEFFEKVDDCKDLKQLSELCQNAFQLPEGGVGDEGGAKAKALAEVRRFVAFKIGQIVQNQFLKCLDDKVSPDGKPIPEDKVDDYRKKLMEIDLDDTNMLFLSSNVNEEELVSPKNSFDFQQIAEDITLTFADVFVEEDE